jgi:hypothetical protein
VDADVRLRDGKGNKWIYRVHRVQATFTMEIEVDIIRLRFEESSIVITSDIHSVRDYDNCVRIAQQIDKLMATAMAQPTSFSLKQLEAAYRKSF